MIWLSFIAEKANFLSILKTVFTFYILSGNYRKIIAGRTQCVVHSFAIFSNNILGITVRMPYVLYKKNHPLSWFTSWIRTYMQDGWGFVGLGDSWTILFEHNLRNFVAENENFFVSILKMIFTSFQKTIVKSPPDTVCCSQLCYFF